MAMDKARCILASCYCIPSFLRRPEYPTTASMVQVRLHNLGENESGKNHMTLQNEVHYCIPILKHRPPHF